MIEEENNIKQEKLNLEWTVSEPQEKLTSKDVDENTPISAIPPISEVFDDFTKNIETVQTPEEIALKSEDDDDSKEEPVQLSNGTIPQKNIHNIYPLKTDLNTALQREQAEQQNTTQEEKPCIPTVLDNPKPPVTLTKTEKTEAKPQTTSIFRQAEKKIDNTTSSLGKTLQQARKEKELEIVDVADKTKINRDVIEKMEADNFSETPAPVYTRGYVKKLSEVYGLNVEELVNQYNDIITGERKKKPVEAKKTNIPTLIDDLESEFSLGPAGVQPTVVSHKSSGGVIKKVAVIVAVALIGYFMVNLFSGNEDLVEEKPVEKVEVTDSSVAPIIGIKDLERYTDSPKIETLKLDIPKGKIK